MNGEWEGAHCVDDGDVAAAGVGAGALAAADVPRVPHQEGEVRIVRDRGRPPPQRQNKSNLSPDFYGDFF